MSITIELSHEVEEALRADAEAQGIDISQAAVLQIENSYSRLEPEAIVAIQEALAQPEEHDISHEDFVAKRAEWRRDRDAAKASVKQKAA
ncbi:MAG: hypothetical protein V4671_26935 [Armatimonadota bacterium]